MNVNETIRDVGIFLVAALLIVCLAVVLLLNWRTGSMDCNRDGRTGCFRDGPTHFELLLDGLE